MTIPIATDIDQAFRVCDPQKALDAKDERYIDLAENRGLKSIATTLSRNIARSEENNFLKSLLTGHRGSGKTTELLRLKEQLEEKSFFTIYIDQELNKTLQQLN